MRHRDVPASSVYHRSTRRRSRDPVCVVRRPPNARHGDDMRRREADVETAARREWDAYWEHLHRRSRIGLLRFGNLSGTAARRRFGPPLTLGEWGRGYTRSDARSPVLAGTGAARTSASADALAALREEPSGVFSDDDEGSFSSSDGDDDGEVPSASSPRRRGLSPRTLRHIPSVSYDARVCETSDERNGGSRAASSDTRTKRRAFDSECVVCLCEYAPGESLARLPTCAHLFHRACIERWLCMSRECPKCRTAVASVK